MNKIRFYYTGGNLEDGKKYLKPLSEHSYSVISEVFNDYHKYIKNIGIKEARKIQHAGRCPVLHKTNNTGWVSFINNNIHNSGIVNLKHIFKNYPNSEGYVIHKIATGWDVSIPKGYYLISLPTLYHTKDWFSLPGIIDPATWPKWQKTIQLNSFIIKKKEDIIPDNSPICQWILAKNENVEIEYGLITEKELLDNYTKMYMSKLKINDIDRYKKLKNSELFDGGD